MDGQTTIFSNCNLLLFIAWFKFDDALIFNMGLKLENSCFDEANLFVSHCELVPTNYFELDLGLDITIE